MSPMGKASLAAGLLAVLAVGFVCVSLWIDPTPLARFVGSTGPDESRAGLSGFSLDADVQNFEDALRTMPGHSGIIAGLSAGKAPNEVIVTVNQTWHGLPDPKKRELAEGLRHAWAGIRAPGAPRKARIRIIDLNAREVYGPER